MKKKFIQNAKYAKISDTPFDQRFLIHREEWFHPCFVRQNHPKKKLFVLFGDFWPLPNKNVQIRDHFFPLLLLKDSESLTILDIRLQEVGAKRRLSGTSKVNTQTQTHTHTHTHKHMDISAYRKHRAIGLILWQINLVHDDKKTCPECIQITILHRTPITFFLPYILTLINITFFGKKIIKFTSKKITPFFPRFSSLKKNRLRHKNKFNYLISHILSVIAVQSGT